MAHIQIRRQQPGGPTELIINGVDFSMEAYNGYELVAVGDDAEWAEVGFRFTIGVGRLDLDTEQDVTITDRLPAMAQRVRELSGPGNIEIPPPSTDMVATLSEIRAALEKNSAEIARLRDQISKADSKTNRERTAGRRH